MSHPDQRYVQALINNDRPLIREVYEKFAGNIERYVLRNGGSVAEAKDVFQDALIAIYQKARSSDFVLTCPFEAYLFMVSKSKWINQLNSSRKKKETTLEVDGYINVAASKMADETEFHSERLKLLEGTLQRMSEGCQSLLREAWTGKPMADVAENLSLSYAYARKKKSECIAKLMKMIKENPQFVSLSCL